MPDEIYSEKDLEKIRRLIADAPVVTDDDPEANQRLREEIRKELRRLETN